MHQIQYDDFNFNFNVNLSPIKKIRKKPISTGKALSKQVKTTKQIKAKLKSAIASKTINTDQLKVIKNLPGGWKKVTRIRVSGSSAGRSDSIFYSPDGRRLRSKPELEKYLNSIQSELSVADLIGHEPIHSVKSPGTGVNAIRSDVAAKSTRNQASPISKKRNIAVESLAPTSAKKRASTAGNSSSSAKKARISAAEKATASQLSASDLSKRVMDSHPGMMFDDPSLPTGWKREIHVRSKGDSLGRVEVYIICPEGKKLTNKRKLKRYLELRNLPYSLDDFDFTCYGKNNRKSLGALAKTPAGSSILQEKPLNKNQSNMKPSPNLQKSLKSAVAVKRKMSSDKLRENDEPDLLSYLGIKMISPRIIAESSPMKCNLLEHYRRVPSTCCEGSSQELFSTTMVPLVDRVRGVTVACGLSSARAVRRSAALYADLAAGVRLQSVTEAEEDVPAGWVYNLLACRPELSGFDASAVQRITDVTRDFVRSLAESSYHLVSDAESGASSGLQYNHVAELVAQLPSLQPLRLFLPRRYPVSVCRKLAHPTQFFSFTS